MLRPEDVSDELVRTYDFTSPEMLSDLQQQLLGAGFDSFARQLGLQLTAKTRMVVQVEYEGIALIPYAQLPNPDDGSSAYVYSSLRGENAQMVTILPVDEALLWAARLVGGTREDPREHRTLTAVERALVWSLTDEHLDELHLALDGLVPELRVESLAYRLLPDVVPADELVATATFTIVRGPARIPLTVAIPGAPILRAFGRGAMLQDPAVVRRILEQAVQAAPVEVALQFDRTRVNPAIVLGLRQGDVVPLEHLRSRPLALTLANEPIVRVAVGANGGRLACMVVDSEGM